MDLKTIFITGTDTGVGKTILTGLLLTHLREQGCRTVALKPFCSGRRDDIELLRALQEDELTSEQINPFYFREPVAPVVASRLHRRPITMRQVRAHLELVAGIVNRPASIAHSQSAMKRPSYLLIEGMGGLMVPLGEDFLLVDLIQYLRCPVIVVARNQLGTINHTLLTVEILGQRTKSPVKVVLMGQERPDFSARSNLKILAQMLAPIEVFSIPFLGLAGWRQAHIKKSAKKVKKVLASILGSYKVINVL